MGRSLPKEFAVVAFWSWEREGRGGTWGIAVDIVRMVVEESFLFRVAVDKEMLVSGFSSASHRLCRYAVGLSETPAKRPRGLPCDRVPAGGAQWH